METKEQLLKYIDTLQKESEEIRKKYEGKPMLESASNDLTVKALEIEEAEHKLFLLGLDSPCDDWQGGYGKGQL